MQLLAGTGTGCAQQVSDGEAARATVGAASATVPGASATWTVGGENESASEIGRASATFDEETWTGILIACHEHTHTHTHTHTHMRVMVRRLIAEPRVQRRRVTLARARITQTSEDGDCVEQTPHEQ